MDDRRKKKGKDTVTGPVFPRLHVNDAGGKGGPRAPPRNKMALFEQLGKTSRRPSPAKGGDSLPPPIPAAMDSSSFTPRQSRGCERSSSSAICDLRVAGSKTDTRRSVSPSIVTDSVAECSAPMPLDSSERKRPCGGNDDEGDFMVPAFLEALLVGSSNTVDSEMEVEILNSSCHKQKTGSDPSCSPARSLKSRDMLTREIQSSDGELGSSERKQNTRKPEKCRAMEEISGEDIPGTSSLNNGGTKCAKSIAHGADVFSGDHDHKAAALPSCADKAGDNCSPAVDSMPRLKISPDDVAGLFGQKGFWKVRLALMNQQKAFALQVFELHRLIKVQKVIAESPHILLEGDPSFHKLLNNNGEANDDTPANPNKCLEHPGKNAAGSVSVPSCSRQPTPTPGNELRNDPRSNPNANQWLVPLVLPSEGFVFKPCSNRHYPPADGIASLAYGSCMPPRLPHQQPPGALAITNSFQHSYPLPITNEASAPTMAADGNRSGRVIKAVPHHAGYAAVSAARIFRSIQEGRQQQKG